MWITFIENIPKAKYCAKCCASMKRDHRKIKELTTQWERQKVYLNNYTTKEMCKYMLRGNKENLVLA